MGGGRFVIGGKGFGKVAAQQGPVWFQCRGDLQQTTAFGPLILEQITHAQSQPGFRHGRIQLGGGFKFDLRPSDSVLIQPDESLQGCRPRILRTVLSGDLERLHGLSVSTHAEFQFRQPRAGGTEGR